MHSDKIYVLDKGGVKESGSFHDLSIGRSYEENSDENENEKTEEKENLNHQAGEG